MRNNRSFVLCGLLVLMGSVAVAQRPMPSPGKAMPAVEVKTQDGIFYVRLFGEDDGPVRIPVKSDRFSSVLMSIDYTEGEIEVSLAAEQESLRLVPAGSYKLSFGKEQAVLPELDGLGLGSWEMRARIVSADTIESCCSCGKINCCPFPGKCLGCSKCGVCCSDGRPEF